MDAPLSVQDRFADFDLIQQLSRGSLGTLYLAQHSEAGRVLLRVVAEDAQPEVLQRVRDDIARLEQVESAGITTLTKWGEVDGRLHYALRYPGDTTLLRLVRELRPLDGEELLWLAKGMAESLVALHKVGLYHGDLWPGKVALTVDGPVLVELGWSQRVRDPQRRRSNLELLADWRGLAASLVFAATGELPQPGEGGALVISELWSGPELGLPPGVDKLLGDLLGPEAGRVPLKAAARAMAAIPDVSEGTIEALRADVLALGQGGTAVLDPVDSDDAFFPPSPSELAPEKRSDAPTVRLTDPPPAASSSDSELPTAARRIRPGLDLTHLQVLGKGGMGVVHLVLDPHLGRHAALKLIRGSVSKNRMRRFRRETKVTARLDHPGVPSVFEAGKTEDGRDFLLMQYVEGDSLSERIARHHTQVNPKEPRELLHALVTVAQTMAFAHSRRIVHRDLKCANVMLGSYGEVFVMDWGLARDLTETSEEDQSTWTASGILELPAGDLSDITQDGAVLGTPGYIPPEQALGLDVDERADVFALGAMLTEILTGRPPVADADVVERVLLTRSGHIEFPRMRDINLSPELDAIARHSLAMEPGDRYATAREFAADLDAYLEGRSVSVYSYPLSERIVRWARQHPTFSASVTIAVVLSIVAAVGVAQVRAEDAAQRQSQCRALVKEGEVALLEGRPAAAREHFAQALALVPTDPQAVIGRHEAEQLEDEQREAELRARAEKGDRKRIAELILQGRAHLEAGDAERARRAFVQAMGLKNPPPEASEGLVEAKALLAEQEATERVRRQRARDARLAQKYVEEGQRQVAKRNYEQAQVAFVKAVAFGSSKARELLVQNGEKLLEQRLRDRQREQQARDTEAAGRLVKKARAAERKRDYPAAKAAYLQALAFRGTSKTAQDGLVRVDRVLQARASRRDETQRRRSAVQLRAKAKGLMKEARSPSSGQRGLEAYFAALVAYDRALGFSPDLEGLEEEKLAAVREVARLLRDQGQTEFSQFLLRYGGAEEDDSEAEAEDPVLTFREVDAVTIRSAFGGSVRFLPTQAFPRLRHYLKGLKDRYHVQIQVRCQATSDNPPRVLATGLWVRVEDKVNRTLFPLVKLSFEGGPYQRRVTVSSVGRAVGPFDEAYSLDEDAEEQRVMKAVRKLVEGD